MFNELLDNIPSILLYLLVILSSAALVFVGLRLANEKKKLLGIFVIAVGLLVPAVVAGARYGVGADFFPYLSMNENIASGRAMYFRSIEPASTILITLTGLLHSSSLMFFSFSFITVLCFFLAYKNFFKNDYRMTAVAFFISLCIFYSVGLNTIRSATAISVLALSFSVLLNNRKLKTIAISLVLFVLAFLFHRSALLFLFFIPALIVSLRKARGRSSQAIALVWASYVAVAILVPVIFSAIKTIVPLGDYGRYLNHLGESFSIPLANFVMLIPIVFSSAALRLNQNAFDNPKIRTAYYFSLFYIPMSIMTGWVTYSAGLSRISFMFDPIIICLIAYLACTAKFPRKWRIAAVSCVFIVTGAMFIRNVYWAKILPYRTIFQAEQIQPQRTDDKKNQDKLRDDKDSGEEENVSFEEERDAPEN